MEWEPTLGNAKQETRDEPRWASREEIERRRQAGLCLRCGREDYFVRYYQAKARASSPSRRSKKKKRLEDGRPKAKTKDVKVARAGPKKATKAKKVYSRSSDTPDESRSEDEE